MITDKLNELSDEKIGSILDGCRARWFDTIEEQRSEWKHLLMELKPFREDSVRTYDTILNHFRPDSSLFEIDTPEGFTAMRQANDKADNRRHAFCKVCTMIITGWDKYAWAELYVDSWQNVNSYFPSAPFDFQEEENRCMITPDTTKIACQFEMDDITEICRHGDIDRIRTTLDRIDDLIHSPDMSSPEVESCPYVVRITKILNDAMERFADEEKREPFKECQKTPASPQPSIVSKRNASRKINAGDKYEPLFSAVARYLEEKYVLRKKGDNYEMTEWNSLSFVYICKSVHEKTYGLNKEKRDKDGYKHSISWKYFFSRLSVSDLDKDTLNNNMKRIDNGCSVQNRKIIDDAIKRFHK